MKRKFHFFPVDWATWFYLLVLSLMIVIFSQNQPYWHNYIIYNCAIAILVFLIVRFLPATDGKLSGFLRHWYPILLSTFLYEETGYLIHLIFPGFFDAWINNLEFAAIGCYPTVWLGKISYPVLNEYFLMAYFSYYFLLVGSGLALYLTRKIKEFDSMIFAAAITFYISYLGFLLFPVEGPRYALSVLHQTPIQGFFFVPLAQWVVKVGGLHGGCMPSSHVAIAWVVLVYSYKHVRKLSYFLGPLVLSLCIGTVWGRFHYLSDVIAGILVGTLSISLVLKIERSLEKSVSPREKNFSLSKK